MIIFIVPMALALVGTLFFWTQDAGLGWKLVASVLVLVSMGFQWIPAMQVHFLIPLVMQVTVCLSLMLFWRAEGYF